jgi:hypothetical protein
MANRKREPEQPERFREAWAKLDIQCATDVPHPDPNVDRVRLSAFALEMAAREREDFDKNQAAETERHDEAREAMKRNEERFPS